MAGRRVVERGGPARPCRGGLGGSLWSPHGTLAKVGHEQHRSPVRIGGEVCGGTADTRSKEISESNREDRNHGDRCENRPYFWKGSGRSAFSTSQADRRGP